MSKLALVTGGSGAIGGATVSLLRERDWWVQTPPHEMLDFADYDSYKRQLGRWIQGGIPKFDALIFCHGEWYSKTMADTLPRDWDRQYLSRVVLPIDMADWLCHGEPGFSPSCVVMVASTRGFVGGVNTGPYAAACAAQIALMQGYAREWPGVRFNCVAPGHTAGRMGDQVAASGGAKAGSIPQDPAAVAAAIVGLVEGNETGQVLRVVDGQVTRARWVWE